MATTDDPLEFRIERHAASDSLRINDRELDHSARKPACSSRLLSLPFKVKTEKQKNLEKIDGVKFRTGASLRPGRTCFPNPEPQVAPYTAALQH
jgi:hypothetical protein